MQEQAAAGFWLSPQQKSAWKFEQDVLSAPSPAMCRVSLTGKVDPDKLRDALRELVLRHEILRTVFRRQTGMKVPIQVVQETGDVSWQCSDFSAVPEELRESQLQQLWDSEKQIETSLETGPTLRATLSKMGSES